MHVSTSFPPHSQENVCGIEGMQVFLYFSMKVKAVILTSRMAAT